MSSNNFYFDTKVSLVKRSLITTIKEFRKNAANFFYEEELRSQLFIELRKNFEDDKLTIPLIKDKYLSEYLQKPISPVKAEYGKDAGYYSKYNISNMDIAILSNEPRDKGGLNNFQRRCDIIIEIKYSTEKLDSKHAGFVDDIKKIKNAESVGNFLGLAICFDLYDIKGEIERTKFLNEYKDKEKNIIFEQIEIEEINLSNNTYYAIYVTPKETYIYGEKK